MKKGLYKQLCNIYTLNVDAGIFKSVPREKLMSVYFKMSQSVEKHHDEISDTRIIIESKIKRNKRMTMILTAVTALLLLLSIALSYIEPAFYTKVFESIFASVLVGSAVVATVYPRFTKDYKCTSFIEVFLRTVKDERL